MSTFHTPKPRINIPDAHAARTPHTVKDLRYRIDRISKEIEKAFTFIKGYPKSVSFFGSARIGADNEHYQSARRIAERLSKLGFSVVTGGGPGIMEAANRGAYDAGGTSLGFNIELPHEQIVNQYVTDFVSFHYFFTRKVALSFSAEAYLFFPGGFGTLDEFFEILTLVQTRKIVAVPIILVGSDYWKPLDEFIKKNMLEHHNTIDPDDTSLYLIADNEDEIIEIVKRSPMLRGFRYIHDFDYHTKKPVLID